MTTRDAKRFRLTFKLHGKFDIWQKTADSKATKERLMFVSCRHLRGLLDTAKNRQASHKVQVEIAAKRKPNILLLAFYFHISSFLFLFFV
jgi:hypothetical protein